MAQTKITNRELGSSSLTNTDWSSGDPLAWSNVDKTGALPSDIGAAPSHNPIFTGSVQVPLCILDVQAANKWYVDNQIGTISVSSFVPYTGSLSGLNLGTNSLTAYTIVTTGITIPTGAISGYVLTTDANGNAYWAPVGDIGTFVPYTGATSSVDLGEHTLTASSLYVSGEGTISLNNYGAGIFYIPSSYYAGGANAGISLAPTEATATTSPAMHIRTSTSPNSPGDTSIRWLASKEYGWVLMARDLALGAQHKYIGLNKLNGMTAVTSLGFATSWDATLYEPTIGASISYDVDSNTLTTTSNISAGYHIATGLYTPSYFEEDSNYGWLEANSFGIYPVAQEASYGSYASLSDGFITSKLNITSYGENFDNYYNSFTTDDNQSESIEYILPDSLNDDNSLLSCLSVDASGRTVLGWVTDLNINSLSLSSGINASGDIIAVSGDYSHLTADIFTLPTSASSGYLLTSDSSGNGYWTNPLTAYALTASLSAYEVLTNKLTGTELTTSTTSYPSSYTVKSFVESIVASSLVYKGVIDCSTNPNYPSADAGWVYIVSASGKIGGASGINVEVGDMCICNTDDTPSGDQASVGQYWNVIEKNIDGAVTGPVSATADNIALFDGVTGKVIKDSGYGLSTYATTAQLTAYSLSGHTHTASAISFTATGNIEATDVQSAIEELDQEKQNNLTFVSPLSEDLSGNVSIELSGYEPAFSKGSLTTTPTGVISITNGTGRLYGTNISQVSITQATSATDGYLSSADWSTFNGKEPDISVGTTAQYWRGDKSWQTLNASAVAFTATGSISSTNLQTALYELDTEKEPIFSKGNLTTSPTGVITLTNGTGRLYGSDGSVLSITQVTSATEGYLSSVDWNIFNGKQDSLTFSSPLSEAGGTVSIELSGYATTNSISAFITTANLTGYVPYTGADSEVNLGSENITTTGTGTISYLKVPTNPTSGYVLTSSDASGNAVWAEATGGGGTQVATVSFAGPLAVYTGKLRWTPPGTVTLSGALARVTTPSSGADINFDINKNGTSIVSSYITTETSGGTEFSLLSTSIGKTDYLTVDIDQVGSSIAGSDLVVSIFYIS